MYILKTADGLYWTGVDFATEQRRAKRFDAQTVVQLRASGVLALLFADGDAHTDVRFVRLRLRTTATPEPAI
jgi:predicted GIY-YIG superfamily endonuclease